MAGRRMKLDTLSLLKIYRISEFVHPQQSNLPAATLDEPLDVRLG
jgi:hypothetical protein